MISEVITLALSLNNPFGIVDGKGKLVKFENQAQAYLFVLLDLFQTFPRGFVDVYLYINERQFRGRKSPEEMLADTGEYLVINWQKPNLDEDVKLRKVLDILLNTTCSVFNSDTMREALPHFQGYVDGYIKQHPEIVKLKSQIYYL